MTETKEAQSTEPKKELELYTTREFLDLIKSQDMKDVLIGAEVIGEKDFRKRMIRCVFHDDKTPSLSINEGYAHCFGCGWSGDVVKFVQELYDFSFIQALSFLADSIGVTLVTGSYNPFMSGSEGNGVKISQMEKEWQKYLADMEEKLKSDPSMKKKVKAFFPLEVGYDKKMNYFVFRFTSKAGATLGFTKRRAFETEDESKYPKWRHSAKDKSRVSECAMLYGLGTATKSIKKSREVILVEGVKDTIPFVCSNRKNVVGISGAMHVEQVFETLPEVDKVILAFDGDKAGRKGSAAIVAHLADHFPIENISWIDFGDLDPYDYYMENGSIPEESDIMRVFTTGTLKETYANSNEYNREFILQKVSERKGISYRSAEDFLTSGSKDKKETKKKQQSEKDRLVQSKDDNAMRKLSLKFDVE